MYVLNPDVYLTRRQRLHFVMDDAGELAWSGKTLIGALEYLESHDHRHFRVEGTDDEPGFHLRLTLLSTTTRPEA